MEPGEAIPLFPGDITEADGPRAVTETPALTREVGSQAAEAALAGAEPQGIGNGRAIEGRTVFYRSR